MARVVRSLSFLVLAGFCAVGFVAACQPSGMMIARLGYPVLFVAWLAAAASPFMKRRG